MLLGVLDEYYRTSTDAAVVQLRNTLGDRFTSDLRPTDDMALPYVVTTEAGTKADRKGQRAEGPKRATMREVTVAFNVFAQRRADVEVILEQLEAAFLEAPEPMTLPSPYGQHLATWFEDRQITPTPDEPMWSGSLVLAYDVTKVPQ